MIFYIFADQLKVYSLAYPKPYIHSQLYHISYEQTNKTKVQIAKLSDDNET